MAPRCSAMVRQAHFLRQTASYLESDIENWQGQNGKSTSGRYSKPHIVAVKWQIKDEIIRLGEGISEVNIRL